MWKENVTAAMDILADPAMDAYVNDHSRRHALRFHQSEGQKLFLDFLSSGEAKAIWEKHGYVVLN